MPIWLKRSIRYAYPVVEAAYVEGHNLLNQSRMGSEDPSGQTATIHPPPIFPTARLSTIIIGKVEKGSQGSGPGGPQAQRANEREDPKASEGGPQSVRAKSQSAKGCQSDRKISKRDSWRERAGSRFSTHSVFTRTRKHLTYA